MSVTRAMIIALAGILQSAGCRVPDRLGAPHFDSWQEAGVTVARSRDDLFAAPHAFTPLKEPRHINLPAVLEITSLTALGDNLIVTDARSSQVWTIVLQAGGHTRVDSLLRHGDGPGEARRPIAARVAAEQLAVLDVARGRRLHASSGARFRDVAIPAHVDLHTLASRADELYEDLSRRLQSDGLRFLLQFEDNETSSQSRRGGRRGYLVALDSALSPVDTLVTNAAQDRAVSVDQISHGPPAFSPRFMWSAGDGWIAYARSSHVPEITIVDTDGKPRLVYFIPDPAFPRA